MLDKRTPKEAFRDFYYSEVEKRVEKLMKELTTDELYCRVYPYAAQEVAEELEASQEETNDSW